MNELTIPNNLVVKTETGELNLTNEISSLLKALDDASAFISENESRVREAILKAMIENDIFQAKIDGYTISQVIPKSSWTFNADKFVEETDADVAAAFVSIEETETFDVEKFKAENPELYAKYSKTTSEVKVDEKKLYKMLPSLYNKYATEIKSTKPATLRILKAKGE